MTTGTARTSRIEEIEANNRELQQLYTEVEAMAPTSPRSFPWAIALASAAVGAVVAAGVMAIAGFSF